MKKAYTYLLLCADGSLYCGWTDDLKKRVEKHNAGEGAKYTRARLPVKLIYVEECADKQEAMKREWAIKRLSRQKKWALVEGKRDENIVRG